jgi:hypothetical protein
LRPHFPTLLGSSAGLPVAHVSSGSLSEATVIFGAALALAGIGVSVHLAKKDRLGRVLAFACYLASAEMFVSLVRDFSVLPRVLLGGFAVGVFLWWELRSKRHAKLAPSAEMASRLAVRPPPPATSRYEAGISKANAERYATELAREQAERRTD